MEFHTRFDRLLQRIHERSHPGKEYFIFLYTREFSGKLEFLLNEKGPRKIQEAYDMVTKIESNIASSKQEHFFAPEVKVDDPEDTPDILSPERIASLEIFVREFQERWDPIISQQEAEDRAPDEGYQSQKDEQEFTHKSTKDDNDLVEEKELEDVNHEDEVLMSAPPSNEAIQDPILPAQEETKVNHFPF